LLVASVLIASRRITVRAPKPHNSACRRRHRLLAAFAVGLIGALAGALAHAQSPVLPATGAGMLLTIDQLTATWPNLTAEQQFAAIEQLLRARQFDAAAALFASSHFNANSDRLMARYYEGLVHKAQGQMAIAVADFRALLADHPELGRVRLELADTLYRIEEDASARHHFEQILGGADGNSDLANTARSYIAAIDGRRRWDLSSYFTLAPTTNINQGPESRVVNVNGLPFTLADQNVRKSGVGIAFGAQGSYRQPVSDDLDLVFAAGAGGRSYRDSEYNDTLLNVSVGPRMRFDWGTLGLYAIADARRFGGDDYSSAFGGQLSLTLRLSPQDITFTDATCRDRAFSSNWHGNDLSGQNGNYCIAGGRIEHHFDAITYVAALWAVGHDDTQLHFLDNWNWSAGGGLYRELPLGITAYVQALYAQSNYSGIYPTITRARHDDRIETGLTLTKRDLVIYGFAPSLGLTYTRNASDVAFQRFEAAGLNLTMTKRF
jgi:outer membrane protein